MSLCQQHWRPCILQDERAAFLGKRGVQRHVSPASFKDADESDYHLQAALHRNAHRHFRSHAESPQVMGELIGPSVELSIGQTRVPESDRDIVRRTLNLFLEQLMDAYLCS